MEEQDASVCRLTEEQVREVERRRADLRLDASVMLTDEEMNALWKKCGN